MLEELAELRREMEETEWAIAQNERAYRCVDATWLPLLSTIYKIWHKDLVDERAYRHGDVKHARKLASKQRFWWRRVPSGVYPRIMH